MVLYQLDSAMVAPARFGLDSVQRPYPIMQQGGNYFSLPDFLNTAHTINSAADAEAYLARLALVGRMLDNDSDDQRAQAARGFLAPGWSLDLTLGQMKKLRAAAPGANTMVEQLADELGTYQGIERAGYLQSYLFRAARLVVDTGLNDLNWSREKAVDYMVATTGFNRPRVQAMWPIL